MASLIYHDVLDTVRTPPLTDGNNDWEPWHVANANLMLSVILRETPVLSQTHAFDSGVVLGILMDSTAEEDNFLELIKSGRVRVKLQDKHDSNLVSAFCSKLLHDPNFIFSAWPEIHNDPKNEPDYRKDIVDYVKTGTKQGLPEETAEKIDKLIRFSARLTESPIPIEYAEYDPNLLPSIIKKKAKIACEQEDELSKYYTQLDEANARGRSVLYKIINTMDELGEIRKKALREFVDNAYNTVVAFSLKAADTTLTWTADEKSTSVKDCIPAKTHLRKPFSANDVADLTVLSWKDVTGFIRSSNSSSPDYFTKELAAAKFLAKVSEHDGMGLIFRPKIFSKLKDIVRDISPIAGIFINKNLTSAISNYAELASYNMENKYISRYLGMIISKTDG
ncbi:hypothetical protein EPN96_08675 [bacterium]|nr:MAG: hypothetical protein EPN96_08675 [bacterium]